MTRVLFVTDDYPPISGGISTYLYELTRNMATSGVDVIVIAPKKMEYEGSDKYAMTNLTVIRTGILPKGWKTYYVKVIVQFFYTLYCIKKYKIDIVHSSTWVPCGVASMLACKLSRKPYLLTVYALELLEPQKSRFKTMVMKAVLNNAHRIIAISNYTKSIVEELGIFGQRIDVIPVGVDIDKFARKIDYSDIIKQYNLENKQTILTVASLIFPYKGHDRVITALPQVLKKHPDTVYLIVGDGPRRKYLENLVKELKLENNIIFTGFVASDKLVKYYHACDVFIMPSSEDRSKGYVEGFGLVYLEANACGKPVIGGRCGGILDAIIDDITGLLVEPLNIDEIARALIKILEDRNYSKLLGENGRERAIREFNWEIIAEQTKEVYERILNDSDALSGPYLKYTYQYPT